MYKYTTINRFLFEMLIRGELWFTPPANFNDPFDSSLPIDIALESYKAIEGWETNPEIIHEPKALRPMKFLQELESLRSQMGVSCFSTVPDNLIMWSHYGDHHKGLILKFDVAELQKYFYNIQYVNYSNKIEPVDYDRPASEIIDQLLTRKSLHWKSEREIRIIMKKAGSSMFPKTALKEIIFGVRCDWQHLTDIMHLVQKFGYSSTSFGHYQSGNYDYTLKKGLTTWSTDYKAYSAYGDKGHDEMSKMLESFGFPSDQSPASNVGQSYGDSLK